MNQSLFKYVARFEVHRDVVFRENPPEFFFWHSSCIWDKDVALLVSSSGVPLCFVSLFVDFIKLQLGQP